MTCFAWSFAELLFYIPNINMFDGSIKVHKSNIMFQLYSYIFNNFKKKCICMKINNKCVTL